MSSQINKNGEGLQGSLLLDIENKVKRVEIVLASSFILCALLITIYSIVIRNLGFSTGDWTLELPVTLITWSIFIGSGYNIAINKHINTDFFLKAIFPEKARKYIILIQHIMLLILIVIIFHYGLVTTKMYINTHYKLYELFYIPFYIVFIIMPTSMIVWFFHTIIRIIIILKERQPEE